MNHIGRYLTILGTSREIMSACITDKDMVGYERAKSIYRMAFGSLIAAGMPYSVVDGDVTIETDGMVYDGVISVDSDDANNKEQENAKNTSKEAAEQVPNAEEQAASAGKEEEKDSDKPEEDDSLAFEPYEVPLDAPDETTPAPAKTTRPAVKMAPEPEKAPDAETDETKDVPAENPKATAEPAPAPANDSGAIKHYLAPDVPMLKKRDFTFDFVAAIIKGKESKKRVKAELIVAPIRIDIEHPEIMVGLIGGKKISVSKSSGTKPASIKVGDYVVKVSGRMQDGKFVSSCLLDDLDKDSATIETKTTNFGDKGHITLNDEESNTYVHVLPVTFANNAKNNAEIIYYAYANGEEILGGTDDGDGAIFNSGGEKLELISRWKGDTLYSMVKPSEE